MIARSRGVRCSIARSSTSRISTRSSSGSEPPICSATERFTAVLKFACQEVDEVVVGVDEPRTDAITLRRVLAFLVAAMERPQLLARNPRRRTQYLLSVRRSGISLLGA